MSAQKIINGDCLVEMRKFPDKSFDLVLTDPPYDISGAPPGDSEIMSLGKYNSGAFYDVTEGFDVSEVLSECRRILRKVNIFCFCSNRQIPEIMRWGQIQGFYTTLLVWNKTNSVPFANGVWRQDAEFIVHIREKGAYFEGDSEMKRKVVQMPINPSEYGHPTEKPIELIKKYILIGSKEGDKILDPFMGSGTTLVAAKQLNRNAVGIEISESYCKIAQTRLDSQPNSLFT